VLYRIGRDIRVRSSGRASFSYYGINKRYSGLNISLSGKHQIKNAALALAAIEILTAKGVGINDTSVVEGLRDARWEGRLEIVSRDPRIVLDGAHNPAGISSLCNALVTDFSYRRLIVVFGVLRDKDYSRMLKRLLPLADKIVLTRPKEERAARTEDLLPVASLYHGHIEVVDDSAEALARARSLAGADDLVCVTGSLYLVGEIKNTCVLAFRKTGLCDSKSAFCISCLRGCLVKKGCILIFTLMFLFLCGETSLASVPDMPKRVDIEADSLAYDKDTETYRARGNVIISFEGGFIKADDVKLGRLKNESDGRGTCIHKEWQGYP